MYVLVLLANFFIGCFVGYIYRWREEGDNYGDD